MGGRLETVLACGRGGGGGGSVVLGSGSHGQGAGLGGGRLRPLRGATVALLPAQLVVLEQTLLAAAIRDQQDAVALHASAFELSLEPRPIEASEDAGPLKFSLNKFTFVAGAVGEDQHPAAVEEAILKLSRVARPVAEGQLTQAVAQTFLPLAVVLLAAGVAEGASCQGHGSCRQAATLLEISGFSRECTNTHGGKGIHPSVRVSVHFSV